MRRRPDDILSKLWRLIRQARASRGLEGVRVSHLEEAAREIERLRAVVYGRGRRELEMLQRHEEAERIGGWLCRRDDRLARLDSPSETGRDRIGAEG